MIETIAPLRDNELFATLKDDELSRLSVLCSAFVVMEDALLFTECRPASYLYLITQGQVALQKSIRSPHAKHSRRSTVAVCDAGEAIGWSALVDPFTYTLSATGWTTSRLLRMDAKMLRRALEMFPETGYKVMTALASLMSRRLRHTTHTLISEREQLLARLRA